MTPTTPEALARLDKLAKERKRAAKAFGDSGSAVIAVAMFRDGEAIEAIVAELSVLRAELARVAPLAEAAREQLDAAFMAGAEAVEQQLIHHHEIEVPDLLDGIGEAMSDYFASQDEAG